MTDALLAQVLLQSALLPPRNVLDPEPFVSLAHPPCGTASEAPLALTRLVAERDMVLVPSVEPAVVFASLAASCVPALCDFCIVDVLETGIHGYRLAYPPDGMTHGSADGNLEATSADSLVVPFHADRADPASDDYFEGTAYFSWHMRTAGPHDTVVAKSLVDAACTLLAAERRTSRTGA